MPVRACQKPQKSEDRCQFFLWDDHAKTREQNALANNCRTEPGPPNPAPTNLATPSRRPPSAPSPYTIKTNPSASSRKRSRPINDDFDDEYGLGQVDDDDLNQIMVQVETPSKAAKTTNFTTPAPKRQKLPWQIEPGSSSRKNGLQTPQTDQTTLQDNPFASKYPTPRGALFTPSKTDADEDQQVETPSSFDATPTPNRFSNAVNEDVVKDVFDLLKSSSVRLQEHTEKELRTLLVRHTKNTEGYKRGRDVIRSTVKAKEAKITELTYRINTLEAELEAEKAMVKHLRWETQNKSDT